MQSAKRHRLVKAGFKVGTVQQFLGLSDDEMALINLKVSLVTMLKAECQARGITQQELARLMSSSQSRIAKLEGACAHASLDLICRALFAIGITARQIGKTLASKQAA